jgi:hypothetical protein
VKVFLKTLLELILITFLGKVLFDREDGVSLAIWCLIKINELKDKVE